MPTLTFQDILESNEISPTSKLNDVMNAIYTLVIFSCLWLIESAFNK